MAYMVSLDSFEVSDASSAESARNRIKCNTEPTIVALGPNNFAAAVNNFVAYYQEPLENDSIGKTVWSSQITTRAFWFPKSL